MSYGVTPQGFRRKTFEDIVADLQQAAQNEFGVDVDLSETSPLGKFISVIAYALAEKWESSEDEYNSAYVDTAEGTQLHNVGKYIGIKPNEATKATGQITITGTPATLINAGFLIATATGIQFQTIDSATISGSGTITVNIEAINTGATGNVSGNTITVIVNPQAGVTSVTNAMATSGGQDQESDIDFRNRYLESVAKGGSSTVDSIRAKLLDEVDGVRAAIVIENDTNAADPDGRPPKSINAIVLGGTSADIAKAIMQSKAAGIQAYGSTVEIVQDSSGNNHSIGFSYATEIDIYANITITKNAAYPSDGDTQVKLALIKHIGGTDGTNTYNGLSMGDDVIHGQVQSKIYQVAGVVDVVLELSTDGITYAESNIPINTTEVAQTDNIKVVVTS